MNTRILIYLFIFVFILMGCSSKEARLNQEYERLSREVDGMQEELKATVNAQNAAEDYARAQDAYNKKIEKLVEVRRANSEKGIPLGPNVEPQAQPQDAVKNLKQNFDVLSDQVAELKKKKAKVVEEQMGIQK